MCIYDKGKNHKKSVTILSFFFQKRKFLEKYENIRNELYSKTYLY